MADQNPNEMTENSVEEDVADNSQSSDDSQSKSLKTETPSPTHTPLMVQPSPPKFVSFEDLMAAASGVKNMSIAHEIAVDGDFKLDRLEPPANSIQKQVKEIMHKAFWDAFEEKINEDPPDFGHAVVLINEVKEGLLSILLPQHDRLKSQIEEVLDTDLIKQKMENNAFDIYYYSGFVVTIMSKLCAPARDDRIAKLGEIKDVVPLFKEIFEVLDLMKMDMANFTIQQIRPYIQQQSVEYERKKFDEFLKKQQEANIDGLDLTRDWLTRSCERLKSAVSPTEGASKTSMVTPATLLNGAYMELLVWDVTKLFPETLVLDQYRFLDLGAQTQRLILVTSVLLVTYNTVGESISGVQPLKLQLKDEVCTLLDSDGELEKKMENIAEQINKNVEVFLMDHGFKARDEGQQKTLKGQIIGLKDKENPVVAVMRKRVLDFIQQVLASEHKNPLKVPAGMSVMDKELSEICGQFLRLISHNKSVFGHYYADIIGALLKPFQDEQPSAENDS
ncbi:T-complex protein 11 [Mactra antiquata]